MPNTYLPGTIAIPSALLITGMTQSSPLVVTYTVPSTASFSYIMGQLVRLTVPRTWGMYQANGITGKIIGLGMSTITLNIDSTLFDAFVDGTGSAETPASLAPAGSQNLTFNNFTNQVPFQSLNNIGN